MQFSQKPIFDRYSKLVPNLFWYTVGSTWKCCISKESAQKTLGGDRASF